MEEFVHMSAKELEKIKVLSQVRDKQITQLTAAKKLDISDRHVRRLLKHLNEQGDKSIVSKKRGKPSNHRLSKEYKNKALSLVSSYYSDFGPTLANEYLKNEHDIHLSTETLRLWMIEHHLWIPRNIKDKKIHLSRNRRAYFGELIQIDGSHHDWFEGRAKPCVLMVFVDDATSCITSMHFAESESLEAYFYTLKKHLKNYGIPLSFYGDRCSVLSPRKPKNAKDSTQFQKALKELDCKLILALSPQAKGKVERANRTLQDRLVKELRLKGISSIEEANVILEEFRKKYNKLFSKKPNEQLDVHRPLEGICLEHILCIRETRTLNKDNVLQFKNKFYKISSQDKKINIFKGGKVEIRELINGKRIALFGDKKVDMTPLQEAESPILDEKQIITWPTRKRYTPPINHPYKWPLYINKIKRDLITNVV